MKHGILFVDDEPNVLQGLRRMLHGMAGEWDMRFAGGGREALAALEAVPADVVVSDMRMPGMDGAELLAEVRRRRPETIRIILSGYSDEESVLRTVGPAHQYLAKPCSQENLVGMIRRALALRKFLGSPELRRLLAGLNSLPTPPDIYFRLVELMDSPKASPAQVAEIIAKDVAMTAEVLKLTNSAYFALPSHVTQPLQAVRILGFETLKSLILKTGIFRQFQGNARLGPQLEQINRHSLTAAQSARRIADLERLEAPRPEQAFCAGMLCCIGTLVLLDQLPKEFERMKLKVRTGLTVAQAEREVFGATHAEVGAYLLGLWGFNDPIAEAVAYHHHPSDCTCREMNVLACLHGAVGLGPGCPAYGPPESARRTVALDEAYLKGVGALERLPAWRKDLETLAWEAC